MSFAQAQRRAKGSSDGDVYFVRVQNAPRIKIGVCRPGKVKQRMAQLQTGSPEVLEVVHVIKGGGFPLEKQLHRKFAKHRLRGEWFQFVPEIEAMMPGRGAFALWESMASLIPLVDEYVVFDCGVVDA